MAKSTPSAARPPLPSGGEVQNARDALFRQDPVSCEAFHAVRFANLTTPADFVRHPSYLQEGNVLPDMPS